MDRRSLIKGGASLIKGGASALVLQTILGYRNAAAEQSATIIWDVPRGQVETVREALDFRGKITPKSSSSLDTRGLPLFFILAGTVAIPNLARALVETYRDLRYGGIVVAGHDGQLEIQNDIRLPSGTMIVSNDQGVHIYQVNPDTSADIAGLVKSLDAITSQKAKK
jgi:hypothetical protein